MNNNDRAIQETQFRKNELESYIYNNRHQIINGPYREFTDPALISKIEAALNDEQTWLYGEGAEQNKSVYVQRTQKLRELCEPSHERFREDENFAYSIEYF